jgi:hypothetical protein
MKVTGPQVTSELRDKLQFDVGRHLYGVLGTYDKLTEFQDTALAQARGPRGRRFPLPVNANRELLARIGDEDLRGLVHAEARRPKTIQRRLGQELDDLLGYLLAEQPFLILKQIELIFAYGLDLGVFRTRATNQHHILLLLPGARHGDHVTLFHEAGSRFQRRLPPNLIADNHLWELNDD